MNWQWIVYVIDATRSLCRFYSSSTSTKKPVIEASTIATASREPQRIVRTFSLQCRKLLGSSPSICWKGRQASCPQLMPRKDFFFKFVFATVLSSWLTGACCYFVNQVLIWLAWDYKGMPRFLHVKSEGYQISLRTSHNLGGQVVVWLRFRPVDRRVAGSISDSTFWLIALDKLLTLWCPCSPSSKIGTS